MFCKFKTNFLFIFQPLYTYVKGKPLKETKSTLPSKITAFLYGLVCVGVAFLGKTRSSVHVLESMEQQFKNVIKISAQYLGGILQVSLSIFGAVGGPLMGMFTLGMFTLKGNQRVKSIY